ncbi:MAG: hypothetical protein A2017_04590 [Lentisphaerae bacterium GWF2_44_16]|nr:MAG: hypothetical protein A2017_04590 [Lentisphaerae bacterium GWF2_44_16]
MISIKGGSWISSCGYGLLNKGQKPVFKSGIPVRLSREELSMELPSRHGRFDAYTKLGFDAVSLALKDAGHDEKKLCGIVVSTKHGSMANDIEYYKTTLYDGGFTASPNLFSYTLPGTVLGECAVHFKFRGATFTVGENGDKGLAALDVACNLLNASVLNRVITGWLDSFDDTDSGAAFVVLEKSPAQGKVIRYDGNKIIMGNGEIKSILDLFETEQ